MRRLYYIFILAGAFFLAPLLLRAATVNLYLNKTSFNIGDEFGASIKIDSEGANINAAQATLSYPADVLEIASVDKNASLFNFWLEEPVFDNTAGTLSFIGGTTDGYSGKSLNVLNIVFKVKNSGKAILSLSQGAVTVADGSGINVLTAMTGAAISIPEKNAPVQVVPPPPSTQPAGTAEQPIFLPPNILPQPTQIERTAVKAKGTPAAPEVLVPFYPAGTEWSNATANFLVKWDLPADITDVATAVNSNPKYNPTKSEGLFDNKFFPALDDGIWYLHVRFKNNVGWGDTAHYKISLDTVPPEPFGIKLKENVNKDGAVDTPTPTAIYGTADGLSGIEKYLVQTDDMPPVETQESELTLPPQKPGKQFVQVVAIDFAGNRTKESLTIDILPIAAPIVTSISKEVFVGEGGLDIGGTALPGTTININLIGPAGEIISSKELPVAETGGWAASFGEALKKGDYFIRMVAIDSRGAESFPVTTGKIYVKPRPVLKIFGLELSANWFFALIIIILLIGFAAGYLFYHFWRLQMNRRVTIAQRDVAAAINLIKADNESIAGNISKGAITPKKKNEIKFFLERIKENIEKMENYVLKNINQIKD